MCTRTARTSVRSRLRDSRLVGQQGERRVRDVELHEGVEQRGLGSERPEDRDLVDVGLDGDEARRGSTKAVLGVDALGGFEDSVP